MTKKQIIVTLENNLAIAQLLAKGAGPETKAMATGAINGYKFAIELLKRK